MDVEISRKQTRDEREIDGRYHIPGTVKFVRNFFEIIRIRINIQIFQSKIFQHTA